MAIQKEKERFREIKKRAQVSLTRAYSHEDGINVVVA